MKSLKTEDVDTIIFANRRKVQSFEFCIGAAAISAVISGVLLIKGCRNYVSGFEGYTTNNSSDIQKL